MAGGSVKAKWVGPGGCEAQLPDGARVWLETNVTVLDIPKGEAETSANWEVVSAKEAKTLESDSE